VVRHFSRHPDQVGATNARPMVAGDSSGGNLAAAVSLALGNEGAAPAAQFLIYPALDPGMSSPSYAENAKDDFLSASEMEWYWAQYLGESNSSPSPFAAPALADDLSKMPRTVIVVAGCDPLRDDGIAFADRLSQAGVNVELFEYDDMVHGFFQYTRTVSTGRKGIEDLSVAIRNTFT
jgi:acetyl esterase